MNDAPEFFVPDVAPEKQEAAYSQLAKWAGCGVPERRIYSITFVHDGEEWTATVGYSLSGVRYRTHGRGSRRTETQEHLSDSASVLAIFPGLPYIVVTDGAKYSKWVNPFMAGQPKSVTYFSAPDAV